MKAKTYKEGMPKYLDWNQIAELGLLEKINREIMHPLGLAVCRDPADGSSFGALVSNDGEWCYSKEVKTKIIDNDEVKRIVINSIK